MWQRETSKPWAGDAWRRSGMHARTTKYRSGMPAGCWGRRGAGTQRYEVFFRSDEDALTRDIIALASEYGRYGYRRITALLKARRLDRSARTACSVIWRREGLKVPAENKGRERGCG